jgi:hypothetical protein
MQELEEINDIREKKDFKGITFSGYNKSQVKKELLNNLINSKIEQSIYWCSEFICAGHFDELWETILYFYTRHIHRANPKLSIYLDMKIDKFKIILRNGYFKNEIRMRNNYHIRKLFCEIICILCYSKKKHSFEDIKIKTFEFDLTQITYSFKAPNSNYGELVFLENDPKELYIPINELYYHLSKEGKNTMDACYWIEWIILYDSLCKNKKEPLKAHNREKINVDNKYKNDVIWIIWDIFFENMENSNCNKLIQKIINSLLNIFTFEYNHNTSKKRKYILFFIVELLVENITLEEEIISSKDKEQLGSIIEKLDIVYKQIKENEVSPNTDYLFLHKNNDNLDKTIKKLEKMNAFGETFIPRVDSS